MTPRKDVPHQMPKRIKQGLPKTDPHQTLISPCPHAPACTLACAHTHARPRPPTPAVTWRLRRVRCSGTCPSSTPLPGMCTRSSSSRARQWLSVRRVRSWRSTTRCVGRHALPRVWSEAPPGSGPRPEHGA